MPSRRLVLTGAFVVGGLTLFAVGLFMIGERREVFAEKFTVFTEFSRISGLQAGAPVKVSGMAAGEVTDIHVPPSPSAKFRIEMKVREKLHGLVRADSVASIQTEGLVGGIFLNISTGSEQAPAAPPKSTIPGREPFEMADLMQQMSDTVTQISESVVSLRGDLESTVKSVSETVAHADTLIETMGPDLTAMSKSGKQIAANIDRIIADVRGGRGTIGKLVNDDELYKRMQTIAKQASDAIENVKDVSEGAKKAIANFQAKDGPVGSLSSDLRDTLSHARDALADLADNTEALKHNFLFRGFFTRRGYFDLAEISPAEYRQGVFQEKGRKPLRIWLGAAVLFVRAADGSETLTEDGRRRLDSAMATFIEYGPDNVLMVEGYGSGASRDEEYLRSRARAAAVRDYVISKFGLKSQNVGLMALGPEAPGSPSTGAWDGVALALFVDPLRMSGTTGQ
jgi:phospholipid/cholesterol/gamma-HCH transport system substrate-binding protein